MNKIIKRINIQNKIDRLKQPNLLQADGACERLQNFKDLKILYCGSLLFIVPPITVLSFIESAKMNKDIKQNTKKNIILKDTAYGFFVAVTYPISFPYLLIKNIIC